REQPEHRSGSKPAGEKRSHPPPTEEWRKTKNGIATGCLTEAFLVGVQDAIGCSSGEPSKNIRRCGDRSGCLRCVDGVASRQTRPARGADRCLRSGPFAGQLRGRNTHPANGLWRGRAVHQMVRAFTGTMERISCRGATATV